MKWVGVLLFSLALVFAAGCSGDAGSTTGDEGAQGSTAGTGDDETGSRTSFGTTDTTDSNTTSSTPSVEAGTVGRCVEMLLGSGDTVCVMSEPQDGFDANGSQTFRGGLGDLPSSVDHRGYLDGCISVHNQGRCGWCVAHAATAAMEAALCRDEGPSERISEPHLWSLGRETDIITDCDGGWRINVAYDTVAQHTADGTFLVDGATWPYVADVDAIEAARPTANTLLQKGEYGASAADVHTVAAMDVDALKAALADGHNVTYSIPVFKEPVWSINCPDTALSCTDVDVPDPAPADMCECECADGAPDTDCGACPNEAHCLRGYHAILVVGYDDADGGWFTFLNSYGSNWGDDGYGRLSYDYITTYARGGVYFDSLTFPCEPNCAAVEDCTNGVDDDGDTYVDCVDFDCGDDPACAGTVEDCTNGVDDDGDSYVDCVDWDCDDDPACTTGTVEDCTNGVDDDGDTYVDCVDFDCDDHAACQDDPCTPSCTGKDCGDDGCGGSCGSCSGNTTCDAGLCVAIAGPNDGFAWGNFAVRYSACVVGVADSPMAHALMAWSYNTQMQWDASPQYVAELAARLNCLASAPDCPTHLACMDIDASTSCNPGTYEPQCVAGNVATECSSLGSISGSGLVRSTTCDDQVSFKAPNTQCADGQCVAGTCGPDDAWCEGDDKVVCEDGYKSYTLCSVQGNSCSDGKCVSDAASCSDSQCDGDEIVCGDGSDGSYFDCAANHPDLTCTDMSNPASCTNDGGGTPCSNGDAEYCNGDMAFICLTSTSNMGLGDIWAQLMGDIWAQLDCSDFLGGTCVEIDTGKVRCKAPNWP